MWLKHLKVSRFFWGHSILNSVLKLLTLSPVKGPWQDCQHVLESGEKTSGIYLLRPRNTNHLLQAWCDHSRTEGGWTVIQRRQDGSVNFFRTWDQYKVDITKLSIPSVKYNQCILILTVLCVDCWEIWSLFARSISSFLYLFIGLFVVIRTINIQMYS